MTLTCCSGWQHKFSWLEIH